MLTRVAGQTSRVHGKASRTLEDDLGKFAACVVVISHDRWFLDCIATHILAFEGGSLDLVRRMWVVTAAAMTSKMPRTDQRSTTTAAETVVPAYNSAIARAFVLAGMPIPARHSPRQGPKLGLVIIQAWTRGEPRRTHPAATSRNGVVGSTGSGTPRARHTPPARFHSGLVHRLAIGAYFAFTVLSLSPPRLSGQSGHRSGFWPGRTG